MKNGPKSPARDHTRVCVLLYDGLSHFEFAIAAEIFGLKRPYFGDDWYSFVAASEDGLPARTNIGFSVHAEADISALDNAGTIVLPGWPMDRDHPTPGVAAALLKAHGEGARLVSICSGAFLLASLGLLDGLRATTHWLYADALASRYPNVEVDPTVLFIDHGSVLTSAGSAAGVDLLLHMVRKDFGAERANTVARRLVMPAHRQGDQRQYIDGPVAAQATDRLRPLLDQVRQNPARNWSIDAMADQAAMSRRTFIRRFREATGDSPLAYIRQVRLATARDALETTDQALAEVAELAGYGALASMNLHFKQVMGCTPAAYRRQFKRALALPD